MKKITILFITFFTLLTTAQDTQLFDNSWFLENVIINGMDNIPPSNTEVPFVGLDLNNANDFTSNVCNDLFGTIVYNSVLPNFTFSFISQTLIICNNFDNFNFEPIYFSFYSDNYENSFTYTIVTNSNSTKTLTITSINGDQAIYGSSTLSINKKELLDIEITSNPVVDVITIKNKSKAVKLKAKIFDLKGQLKLEYLIKNKNDSTLNVVQLTSGLYFVVFETDDGRKLTKKIVKK